MSTEKDPVCGMDVDSDAELRHKHDGRDYVFCSSRCLDKFMAEPQRYLQDAVLIAHQQLLRYAIDKGLADTPRTTVVACVIDRKSVV